MFDEDTISQIPGFHNCNGENWVTKIAAKKIEPAQHPPPNRNHGRTLEFAILSLRDCDGSERGWGWQKSRPTKNSKMSAGCWRKCFKCGRDKSPGPVVRHQAAWPSRSTNLVGRLVVWMRLKTSVLTNHRSCVFSKSVVGEYWLMTAASFLVVRTSQSPLTASSTSGFSTVLLPHL